MNLKIMAFSFTCILIYPALGFSTESVICYFRDSQNVYREFMLNKSEANNGTFTDAEKKRPRFGRL